MYYLGINTYSHDSSACILDEAGNVIAAVEEERFTQVKGNSVFPKNSIEFCLKKANITTKDLKGIGVGWRPKELLFDRIFREYFFEYHPRLYIFIKTVKKLWRLWNTERCFKKNIGKLPKGVRVKYYKHHTAHAASAFYPSGFDSASFFTIDARGEYQTSLWGEFNYRNGIKERGSLRHPNSIGCIWGAITEYCGFKPGWQKAGTTMAFAALGEPKYLDKFKQIIKFKPENDSDWLDIDTDYFSIGDCKGEVTEKFIETFGKPATSYKKHTKVHRDIAATLQKYTEILILEKLNDIHKKTNNSRLVMAGGVSLNSVANGYILEKTPFKELFIQPAANDAGVAIGAAHLVYQEHNKGKKIAPLNNVYLGPSYSPEEIEAELKQHKDTLEFSKEKLIYKKVAKLLYENKVVMWFQGRVEFGPRALGARSILAPATDKSIIDELNKTKHRESFRPFAISMLEDKSKDWLVRGNKSPYMLLVDRINDNSKDLVPAAQHVDGSVRIQTVNQKDNGIYYSLLKEYSDLSDIPLFINTSFNIKGLPIVNSPKQAIEAFIESKNIKYLAMESYIVTKK